MSDLQKLKNKPPRSPYTAPRPYPWTQADRTPEEDADAADHYERLEWEREQRLTRARRRLNLTLAGTFFVMIVIAVAWIAFVLHAPTLTSVIVSFAGLLCALYATVHASITILTTRWIEGK